jgi:carbamoyl-phosphate synthase large subunit
MATLNVLFTSSGRRVELMEIFKNEGYVTHAADCDPTAPTLYKADCRYIVPRILEDPDRYVEAVMAIATKKDIHVVVPLIDTELEALAEARKRFAEKGIAMMISDPDGIRVAFDKYETYKYFNEIGLPTPQTLPVEDILEKPDTKEIQFPALLKPRFGSAGIGIMDCDDLETAEFFHRKGKLKDYIIQEKVRGEEITTDILGDGRGNMLAAVQRKRLKIRGGEVERGITVKYEQLHEYAERFTREYKPFGTVNIQCFYNPETGEANYIEINPRFGGGYPLAYNAGANFPGILRQFLLGEDINVEYTDYRPGIIMSRYDSAVYWVAE